MEMKAGLTFAGFKSRLRKARKRVSGLIDERAELVKRLSEIDRKITGAQKTRDRLESGRVSSKGGA